MPSINVVTLARSNLVIQCLWKDNCSSRKTTRKNITPSPTFSLKLSFCTLEHSPAPSSIAWVPIGSMAGQTPSLISSISVLVTWFSLYSICADLGWVQSGHLLLNSLQGTRKSGRHDQHCADTFDDSWRPFQQAGRHSCIHQMAAVFVPVQIWSSAILGKRIPRLDIWDLWLPQRFRIHFELLK